MKEEVQCQQKAWGTGRKALAALFLFGYGAALGAVAWLCDFGPVKIVRCYVLIYALFYLALIDLREYKVPNRALLVLVGVRAVLLFAEWLLYPEYGTVFLASVLSGAAVGMGILLLGYFVSRRGIGAGDIKLFGVIGLYTGPMGTIFILFLALLAASVCSAVLLLTKKKKGRDEIPFVPFAAAGAAVALLLGI